MARRRRAPYPGPTRALSDPDTADTVTHASETAVVPETAPAFAVERHEASVHDALLETVSVEALQSHDGAATELSAEAEPVPKPDERETGAEPVSPVDALAIPVAKADDGTPDPVQPAAPEPTSIVTPGLPAPASRRTLALEALGELSETNATVVGFLRSEGAATLAHWRSLAGAKSPADAVRLQVDEMQRAADASLTCLNTLARRAGRFAGLLKRD